MRAQRDGSAVVVAAAIVLGVVGTVHGIPVNQGTPCRVAPDTASAVLYSVKQVLAANSLDTSTVAIVSDSATCQAVVNSYNNSSDSAHQVNSGYVMSVPTGFVLYVLAAPGSPYKTEVVVFFDTAFRLQVRMAGLN